MEETTSQPQAQQPKTEVDVKKFSYDCAGGMVDALAIARKMNQLQTQEDLRNLLAAGIETAIEDYGTLVSGKKPEAPKPTIET